MQDNLSHTFAPTFALCEQLVFHDKDSFLAPQGDDPAASTVISAQHSRACCV